MGLLLQVFSMLFVSPHFYVIAQKLNLHSLFLYQYIYSFFIVYK